MSPPAIVCSLLLRRRARRPRVPGRSPRPSRRGFTRQAQGCEAAHGPRAHGGDVGQVLRGRFAADLVPAATGSVEAPEPGSIKSWFCTRVSVVTTVRSVEGSARRSRLRVPPRALRCAPMRECIGHSFVMRLDNGHEGAERGLSQLRERRLARGMVPRFTRCLRIHTSIIAYSALRVSSRPLFSLGE